MGYLSKILLYEQGELGIWEMIELFAELVNNGQAFTLQGHYGRQASKLIEAGYLTADGEITDKAREEFQDESIN
jgi:hypothetical protein